MEVCPEGFSIAWGAGQNGCERCTQMAGQLDCVIPKQKLFPHLQAVQMLEPSPLGLSENKCALTEWTEVSHFTPLDSSFYSISHV